jgi:hypothetical protein
VAVTASELVIAGGGMTVRFTVSVCVNPVPKSVKVMVAG